MEHHPIERLFFEASSLHRDYPPVWSDSNKRLVFEIACSSGYPVEGEVGYARWPVQALPKHIPSFPGFTVRPGIFAYADPDEPGVVAWHLNFSDPDLFVAYGSSLLAQDELQVAEHPALGSVREALIAHGLPAATMDHRGYPTPVTVTGVQRRCAIDTRPDPLGGNPEGLYGNAFARASEDQVRRAVKSISPPTVSNILAMAAPPGGYGEYGRDEVVYILATAYAGFSAARAESRRLVPGGSRTVTHTGFWGCGAFGGNRMLMTIIQALAGALAGMEIVFWAFDEEGAMLAREAYRRFRGLCEDDPTVDSTVDRLVGERFLWGVSDGN